MSGGAEAIWHEFAGRGLLAEALADAVAARLEAAFVERDRAVLVVSGGTTPNLFLSTLSERDIDWSKVTVTLADERMVAPSSTRSNEHLITRKLLQANAARADFVGLYSEAGGIEEAARAASHRIAALPQPFDVVVLGMGTDGHTASFFPDAANLATLLDPDNRTPVLPVISDSAGEPRLTLSLAVLASARHICLHIEGLEKKELLRNCLDMAPRRSLPIGAVFSHAGDPIEVYWAPSGEA